MANFSDMDTPDIIRKGRAYGLKPSLGKKKLKIKLKEAFRFHRQVESSSSEEEQPLEFPDKGSNPKMTKPFQECSTQNKPTSSEFNFETDSESDDTTNKNNVLGTKVIEITSSGESNDGSDVEELHKTLFVPVASQDCDLTSGSDDEKQTKMKNVLPKKTKARDEEELNKWLVELVTSDAELYCEILMYKPIYLSRFKQKVKASHFKCSTVQLMDFLDKQGITFSTADERREKFSRRKVRTKSRKKSKKTV
uniref:Structure-specific endonuclease subunit SLX4 n=1 Tax=Ciona savignyi TaxID=51511 RepID=H2YP46_CIOSA